MADWVEVRTRAGERGECDYGDYPDCAWDCPGDACSHWRAVKEPSLAEKNRADITTMSVLLRECMNQVERLQGQTAKHDEQLTEADAQNDEADDWLTRLVQTAMAYVQWHGVDKLGAEGRHGNELAAAAQAYHEECFALTDE